MRAPNIVLNPPVRVASAAPVVKRSDKPVAGVTLGSDVDHVLWSSFDVEAMVGARLH